MNRIRNDSKTWASVSAAYGVVWLIGLIDWMWAAKLTEWLTVREQSIWPYWVIFSPAIPISIAWFLWATWPVRRDALTISLVASLAYVPLWQFGVFAIDSLSDVKMSDSVKVLLAAWRIHLADVGIGGLFFIGLAWVVWGVERASQFYERLRQQRRMQQSPDRIGESLASAGEFDDETEVRIWNPLDPRAWFYGRRGRKLNQSLTALLSYSFLFMLAFLIMTQMGGCQQIYEMPAGGGEQQMFVQTVKVQKIIKKKYVINPFSSILFKIPPIDEIKLQLSELTKHAYTVGYGEGEGPGFAGGTKQGRVRFIRLEYMGGDWDQDFGKGADENMLIEYGIRTKHKVAKRTESIKVAQLKTFKVGKSPPFVFLTGQRNISLSNSEVKILKTYLLDNHGMLFCDNGGSRHFHNQFLSLMNRVLPKIRPVPVPLDDVIHRKPVPIPFLPYVAPHGGKDALGWKVDGRWVAYYHPGDIGDAWSDEHAGVDREVWEACYQLGTNVIFYAHVEYSKWLQARKKKK